jgi:arylsulfatase A-like enzyme
LIGPHDPYIVPQKYLDMYDLADVPLPPSYGDELADKPAIYQRMRETRFGQLSEREVREGIRHFWAYCTYLDDLFGRLLAALDATGQRENTLVLYTSDHGDYCGEHGLFAKGIPCFQGAYRVPAIIRWPAGVADAGRREDAFVSLADFGPTFLEAAGVAAHVALDAGRLASEIDTATLRRRLAQGGSATGWRGRPAAISMIVSNFTRAGWGSLRDGSRFAIRRADGDRAPAMGSSLSRGASCWRLRSFSTMSRRTRSRIWPR